MFWVIHVICMMNGICFMPFSCAFVNADDAQIRRHLAANCGRSKTRLRSIFIFILNVFIFFSLECVIFNLNVFILDVNALSDVNVMHINVRNS